ncbi:hypothetical protein AH553_24590 [Salmonella enterica subsp. diarizonae]|nr:hypothetical protein [Salmonella enterica subsp. diarizonae]
MHIDNLFPEPVHEGDCKVLSVKFGNEVIGYACPNYDRNKEVKPFSAVYIDGNTIGDFFSIHEEMNFLFNYHMDFQMFLTMRKEVVAVADDLFNNASQCVGLH